VNRKLKELATKPAQVRIVNCSVLSGFHTCISKKRWGGTHPLSKETGLGVAV
jgi:hypothetical protein